MTDYQRFTPRDLTAISNFNSVQASQGGTLLLSVTLRNYDENSFSDLILLLNQDGKEELRFQGSSPLLSPDGASVAYELDSVLCVRNLQTSEIKKIASLKPTDYFMGHMAEQNFAWSPDSKSIAYISTDAKFSGQQGSAVVIDHLLYKTKGGRGRNKFTSRQCCHIWIAPLTDQEPFCITDGAFNEHSISWSPDGKRIAFISDRSGNPDRTHNNDLFTIDIGTRDVAQLVTGTGTRFKPVWSPSGDCIAFLADESKFTSKDSPSPDVQLYTVQENGSDVVCHTRALNRRVDNLKWNNDGSGIFFTAGDHGSTALFTTEVHDGSILTVIHEPFLIKDYCLLKGNGQIAIIKNSIDEPDELCLVNINSKTSKALTTLNADAKGAFRFENGESFLFDSHEGIPVQGWIIKPYNFIPSSKYPCVLVIHGGPHNMYGFEFDEKMQVLSSAGYGVVFINPRGSTGYGQEFTNGNLLNWGGNDYEDLLSGMNHVINEYKWVDRNRLGVTGQSYGGFLTNWIITQSTLFKAAVSDGGISNLISFAGTSLYHCLIEAEFNGNTWENYDLLWKWSPLKYVHQVNTPTLFLHGETDNEVPIGQAEEMFSALQRLGIKSQLVRYQHEGHGWRPDLLPQNRIDLYERTIDWFNRFLNQ